MDTALYVLSLEPPALYFLYATVPTADAVHYRLWKGRGLYRDAALSYTYRITWRT
jgi:hypothetical protein